MGPFIRSNDSSEKMKIRLLIALIPFILFSFYKNGISLYINDKAGILGLLYPLIFVFVGIISSVVFEIIYLLIKKEKIKDCDFDNILLGLILSLILPINIPIYVLILGVLVSVLCNKLLKYDINTTLIGYVFIALLFSSYFNSYDMKSSLSIDNFMIINLVLCFLGFIYLILTNTIKWRIPIMYIITVLLITYVIGTSLDQSLYYPIYHLLNGGLLFSSIYIATDSSTSCVTPIGQVLQGIFLGILTVIFRYIGIEGVILSILIMNLFVPILDDIGSKSRFDIIKSFLVFVIAWVLTIAVCLLFSISNKNNEKLTINDTNNYSSERL